MSPESTMSNPRLSDIATATPALNKNSSNWSIFKIRFRLTLSPGYGLYHHYVPDLKYAKPTNSSGQALTDPKRTMTEAEVGLKEKFEDELGKWEKNEDISQK